MTGVHASSAGRGMRPCSRRLPHLPCVAVAPRLLLRAGCRALPLQPRRRARSAITAWGARGRELGRGRGEGGGAAAALASKGVAKRSSGEGRFEASS